MDRAGPVIKIRRGVWRAIVGIAHDVQVAGFGGSVYSAHASDDSTSTVFNGGNVSTVGQEIAMEAASKVISIGCSDRRQRNSRHPEYFTVAFARRPPVLQGQAWGWYEASGRIRHVPSERHPPGPGDCRVHPNCVDEIGFRRKPRGLGPIRYSGQGDARIQTPARTCNAGGAILEGILPNPVDGMREERSKRGRNLRELFPHHRRL